LATIRRKRGRPSHHPLIAFLSEARRLLWATLRAGRAGTANGCVELLAQPLTLLPPGHRVALVRADAGFFLARFLTFLESHDLPYIIMARLTPVLRRVVLHRLSETAWRRVSTGIDVAEYTATLPSWAGQTRRFVCLRQALRERPHAAGRRLVDCPGYTSQLMVTSVPYAAELVCRMYTGRADSENRIKELKEDLSLDTFCLHAFDATDATFRLGGVAYNFLAGFRETVLPRCWVERRLRAVRDFVFLVGADLIPQGRRLQIRFAVPREERGEFLDRLRTLSAGLPIAAQLEWTFTDEELPSDASQPAPSWTHPSGIPDAQSPS
jgi:Transposase DDE domain group 1